MNIGTRQVIRAVEATKPDAKDRHTHACMHMQSHRILLSGIVYTLSTVGPTKTFLGSTSS